MATWNWLKGKRYIGRVLTGNDGKKTRNRNLNTPWQNPSMIFHENFDSEGFGHYTVLVNPKKLGKQIGNRTFVCLSFDVSQGTNRG